jgi:predicted O-methyltransferase YrrM
MSGQPQFDTPSFPVRAFFAMKAAAGNPALMWELVRKFCQRQCTADRHARRLDEYAAFVQAEIQAIAAVTSAMASDIDAVLQERDLHQVRDECAARAAAQGIGPYAWAGFAEVCYAICRLKRPRTVLETGVAFGWTSAFILAALEKNSDGHLHSIDLPAFRPGAERIAGAVIPDRLRHRWTLRLAPQSKAMPQVLEEIGPVDFFHYDSDKTYQGMKWGYETVWPRMSPGGVLMSDDVDNDAFLELAAAANQRPIIIIKPIDGQRVALLKRG